MIDIEKGPESVTDCILEEDKPQVERVQVILAKIIKASGLENLNWCLYIADAPGKSSCVSLLMARFQTLNVPA